MVRNDFQLKESSTLMLATLTDIFLNIKKNLNRLMRGVACSKYIFNEVPDNQV